MPSDHTTHLSKSRFVAGVQCHKLLWWKAHEPDAVELQPDKVLQDRFDQGRHVGEVARERFPDGVLIDRPYDDVAGRLAATREALDAGAGTIFEATFEADGVRVAVDILQRTTEGFAMTEVKSASSQKVEHVYDAAVQVHVLRRNGLDVRHTAIMHLNKEHEYPDTNALFARTEVSELVDAFAPNVPIEAARQLRMLQGPLPDPEIGMHCYEPYACPFLKRCWPQSPEHIIRLYNVGPTKAWAYMQRGINWMHDLPANEKLPATAQRQLRAMRENRLVVEPTLARDLEPFGGVLGFLDFETVSRAIPVWPGVKPWGPSTAQFSYHESSGDATYRHVGYLAEGPHDPRPELAERMLVATRDAERVVMYSSYERRCIRDLQRAVPGLAADLRTLEHKLIDLLPVVRNNVYHPDFQGSFSIKYVLHPMVPDLTYNDLVIVDGLVASVEIARLLFVAHKIPPAERDRLRVDLLAYCERDTWAMVRLLQRLRELA
ncbi:MAG TPA: DUF2779 domain-containing protein [Gemmatimonadales bacterium]